MLSIRYINFLLLPLLILLFGCSSPKEEAGDLQARTYRIEKIGPAQVVQLYVEGFDNLTQREKLFAYYLYLAGVAGRDIAVDQHHPNALEVRDMFEEVYKHSTALDPDLRRRISDYLKLFWVNNGFYDGLTSRKFVPGCTVEEFKQAVTIAQLSGAQFSLDGEPIEKKLDRLKNVIFDPDVDPIMTNKAPGHDWLKTSAVNFYSPNLTYAEVERWAQAGKEKNPLNSTVVKENGQITEDVWRAGSESVPPGRYASQLNATISYLEMAIPYAASGYQAETLWRLIHFLRTGDLEDFRRFNIHWVKDSSRVDFNLGFIEAYLDPRGKKAQFQSVIYYEDPDQTRMMKGLAQFAQYFEDKAPWRDEFKKKIERSPIASAVNVIVATGGVGPVSPIGINLPNEQAIRERHGSKSVSLSNIIEAGEQSSGRVLIREFAWDEEEVQNEIQYGSIARKLHTAMHEVIGHGSGKASAKLGGKDPSEFLPGYYNTLEETRSDLMSLWNAWDPKLIAIGVARDTVDARKIGETMYQQRVRTALNQLRRIGKSDHLEQDHLKGRQLIVHYLIKNSNAVRVERRNGKTYYRILDFDAAHRTVGELLAEIMRIKAEGDLPAAKALVDAYGLRVDAELRDEVQQRVKHLDLPAYTGYVMPKLEPVNDPTAKIVDVKVVYPLDLGAQMLEWSAFTKPFRLKPAPTSVGSD